MPSQWSQIYTVASTKLQFTILVQIYKLQRGYHLRDASQPCLISARSKSCTNTKLISICLLYTAGIFQLDMAEAVHGKTLTFTVTSEHIRLFTFQFFFCLTLFQLSVSVRQIKLTYVGFRSHVKIASRIVSYRNFYVAVCCYCLILIAGAKARLFHILVITYSLSIT